MRASIAATGIVRSGSSDRRRLYVSTMLKSVSQKGFMGIGIEGRCTRNLEIFPPGGHFPRLPFWLMRVDDLLREVVLCCFQKKPQMLLEIQYKAEK
jgi:hypothetical protein